jgi:hypothetical protein
MTSLQLTLPVSGGAPALLNLPYPLTPQGFLELEHAVSGTLSTLRRDLLGASVEHASVHVLPPSDAAEIEYASWMPDRGAIEVASWSAHLHACLR